MSAVVGKEAGEVFNKYYDLISQESDRGAVILAGSILDSGLKKLLQKRLVEPTKSEDSLFKTFGPLDTFDAKIEMSFRLGLIKINIRDQLLKFKSIRNDFAHNIETSDLSNNKNTSRLLEILKDTPDISYAFLEIIKQNKSLAVETKCKHHELLKGYGHRNTFDLLFSLLCMLIERVRFDFDKIEVYESEG